VSTALFVTKNIK